MKNSTAAEAVKFRKKITLIEVNIFKLKSSAEWLSDSEIQKFINSYCNASSLYIL